MKDIIVVAGPTGVGKTKLSVELAKSINAEIINADSMQVYRNMDIGTAKIKEEEKEGVVHHLLDIKDVDEMYSIYDYQKDARRAIEDILSRGKKVIMTGGSGLYIRAALYNYKLERETLKNDYSNYTNEKLYEMVKKIDSSTSIHINNRKRLIRFLNRNDNNNLIEEKAVPLYSFDIIGLTTSRSNLYDIINKRVDKMFELGIVGEARSLFNKYPSSKALCTAIGYKELFSYFNGENSLEEAKEMIKRNSRRYAKRQYTFFNHQFPMKWFAVDYQNFNNTKQEVLKYLER